MALGGWAAAGRSAADRRGAADRRHLAVVGGRDCLPVLDAGRGRLPPALDHRLGLAGTARLGAPVDLVRAFRADRGDVFHVLRGVDHALRDVPGTVVRPARISGHGRRRVALGAGLSAPAAGHGRPDPPDRRALDDVRGAARIEFRPALPPPRRMPDHPRNGRVSPGHVRHGPALPGLGGLDRLERNLIAAPQRL